MLKGRLRVIGGAWRGRRLLAPVGRTTRPTSERVREALFDILGDRVVGATVLDAYAGTGAVGIEALSRGARTVIFVESDPAALDLLRRNLERVPLAEGAAHVEAGDLARVIGRLERREAACGILFADPPYAGGEHDRCLRLLGGSKLLAPGAILVLEHEKGNALSLPATLRCTRTASYGRASLSFFER